MRYSPINPELFIGNRRKLAEQLPPKSVAVFHSNDVMPTSADGTYPFVQQTDLFCLTGIDQEDTILVLCPEAREDKHREILFVRESNEEIAVWEGEKYSQEDAQKVSGIQTIHWTSEFDQIFKPLALPSETIYLNINEHLRAADQVQTRDMRFLKRCRRLFPLHQYGRLAPIMHRLRAVKSSGEIELIRQAADISEKAFRRALAIIQPEVWEFEVEAELIHEFIRNRSAGPAFASIVAAGIDSCTLHYVKNNKQCRDGDLLLMDFGAEYAHYASDVTRTVPVNGRFNPRQRDVYNAVLRIQKAAINLLRPGNILDELNKEIGRQVESELIGLGVLDAAAVKEQDPEKPLYKKYFPHGVSHHLGLDVHDYGDKYRSFEAGMVLTCEPGIYIREEAIGIRIENDILITDDGPVDLTQAIPREADDIEELMQR
jgi:Xaa-Pro aminopeptidase